MSFLKIKAVRLECKGCLPESKQKSKQSLELDGLFDSEDVFSPIGENVNIQSNNGTEKTERQRKDKILGGEKFWRVPQQVQSNVKHKSTRMSPLATNSPTGMNSFPKLVPTDEDSGKVENMKNEIWMDKKRSKSAPGCSYAQTKVRKLYKFRLPNIPNLHTLSINVNRPMKSMVVKERKLRSAGEGFYSLDSNGNSISYNEPQVIDENPSNNKTKKLSAELKGNGKDESWKERCQGETCKDSFPSYKPAEYRVKTAYASSSRMFNTYLESRCGKSVYEAIDKKTDTFASTKKYHVYSAPVLIEKKTLYNRTKAAESTQVGREVPRSKKERKMSN